MKHKFIHVPMSNNVIICILDSFINFMLTHTKNNKYFRFFPFSNGNEVYKRRQLLILHAKSTESRCLRAETFMQAYAIRRTHTNLMLMLAQRKHKRIQTFKYIIRIRQSLLSQISSI